MSSAAQDNATVLDSLRRSFERCRDSDALRTALGALGIDPLGGGQGAGNPMPPPATRRSDRTFGAHLSHAHVLAIEEGRFLYDPRLVQMMADVGRRLAQIDYYTSPDDRPDPVAARDAEPGHEQQQQKRPLLQRSAAEEADARVNRTRRVISPHMTEVLMGDLEDFLQLMAIFQVRLDFLREYHELNHVEIAATVREQPPVRTQLGWLRTSLGRTLGMLLWPARYLRRVQEESGLELVPRVQMPHTFDKFARQRMYGAIFDATLEVSNLVTDVIFIAVNLWVLTEYRWLLYVSMGALVSSYTARLLIGLSDWRQVDWKDPRRVQKFVMGIVLGVFDPNSAFENLIKPSFRDQETLGQNIIGESSGSFLKDPAATLAKSDFNAAKMTVLTTYALLLQDIPQITVELLYILLFQGGDFQVVYWLALSTSLFHVVRQLNEARELLEDIPALRNLVNARHLVFNNELDDDRLLADRARREQARKRHQNRRDRGFHDHDDDNDDGEEGDDAGGAGAGTGPGTDARVDPELGGGSARSGGGGSWRLGRRRPVRPKTIAETVAAFFDPHKELHSSSPLCATLLSRKPQREAYEEFMRGLAPALITEGDFFRVAVTEPGRCAGFMSCLQRSTRTRRGKAATAPYRGVSYQLFNRMEPLRLHASVRSVELTDCVSVDADTLTVLARYCPNLQKLNLSFCPRVDDAALRALADETCPALESVMLDNCVEVGDDGVGHIARCCGMNLTHLSLRNLPAIGDGALEHLGTRCRFLRTLHVERDPQFGAEDTTAELAAARAEVRRSDRLSRASAGSGASGTSGGGGAGFNRITARGLGVLARGAGQSLVVIKLSHVTDKLGKAALLDFVNHLSPFVREVSLSGLRGVDSEVVATLAARARFLRVLRLTNAADVTDVSAIARDCRSLRMLSLGGTSVDKAQVDDVWRSCVDAQVVSFYDPRQLAIFYADQFHAQVARLREVTRAVQQRHSRPRSGASKHASQRSLGPPPQQPQQPQPEALRGGKSSQSSSSASLDASGVALSFAAATELPTRLSRHSRPHPSQEDLLREMERAVNRVCDELTPAHPRKEDVLVHVVNLVDYARRARFRLTRLLPADMEDWNLELGQRDVERGMLEVAALEAALGSARGAAADADYHLRTAPRRFPSTFLQPFGVISTQTLNLKVDFDAETYQFIVPEAFRGVFTHSPDADALVGKISPLNEVTLGRAAKSARRLVQKYWSIPPDAKWYCWAYPVAGARADVEFQRQRDDDHASLRFLTFGGYLYFDSNRHFISASALTVGTALSFNGPFPMGAAAISRLNADRRWRPVTIRSLIPQDAQSMDFCYIFTGERVLPPHVAKYNQHGGFAYRVRMARGRVEGVFFPLADVSDAIIE